MALSKKFGGNFSEIISQYKPITLMIRSLGSNLISSDFDGQHQEELNLDAFFLR